jgi:hypothetical protein
MAFFLQSFQKNRFMKKLLFISFATAALSLGSCGGNNDSTGKSRDSSNSSGTASPDSAANNSIVPPSAAPDNAGNSSLADTSYHAKDSAKKK